MTNPFSFFFNSTHFTHSASFLYDDLKLFLVPGIDPLSFLFLEKPRMASTTTTSCLDRGFSPLRRRRPLDILASGSHAFCVRFLHMVIRLHGEVWFDDPLFGFQISDGMEWRIDDGSWGVYRIRYDDNDNDNEIWYSQQLHRLGCLTVSVFCERGSGEEGHGALILKGWWKKAKQYVMV